MDAFFVYWKSDVRCQMSVVAESWVLGARKYPPMSALQIANWLLSIVYCPLPIAYRSCLNLNITPPAVHSSYHIFFPILPLPQIKGSVHDQFLLDNTLPWVERQEILSYK